MLRQLTTQTLTMFLGEVFSKRYNNPSSDIIEILAGLDDVDVVFTDLVTILDGIVKSGDTGPSAKQNNYRALLTNQL